MKKYHEYMNEISSDELLEGLIGHGLFADKLPPIFTSENFFNYLKNKYLDKNKELPFNVKSGKDYVRYENIRNVNIPRQLSIPNPFAYAKLAKTLAHNWENLKEYFEKITKHHEYKISRIHIRKIRGEKHLFEMNYKSFFKDKNPELNLMVGKKYLVKSDISNCFPSIYSHAIPWAIKGRENSKESKNDWSDKIDEASRLIKHNESNGLLIGPHSSNIISEIILCKIDNELYKKGYRFIRNIDDYECFTENFVKAENFLLDLSKELKKYTLTLNIKKTVIKELPLGSSNDWVHQLNSHTFLENEKINLPKIRNFWDFVLELFNKNEKNSSILNYAIKIISKKKLNNYAIEYHYNIVHHLTLLFPYLVTLLDEYLFIPFIKDNKLIKSLSNNILANGRKRNLFESMSYALFFAMKYNIKLDISDLFKIVKDSNDTIFMLTSYLYEKKFGNDLTEYINLAREISKNKEGDSNWIFIYEILPESELYGDFKHIKRKKISFIKEEYR
ncbi:RNA-directed DNA polymerase [Deferribacteraceae bacterium V6Fe1]|nr:RNA-directed DNA polymerase [Deferribacteraceae bacterium V6Fe1]